jgi:hypothetical protein
MARRSVLLRAGVFHRKLYPNGKQSRDIPVETFEHLLALCKRNRKDSLPSVTAARICATALLGNKVLICTYHER